MLTGDPVASIPVASASLPTTPVAPEFIKLQDDSIVDLVSIVILTPFTRDDA